MGYERDLYALIALTLAAGVMVALLMFILRRPGHRACVWCRYNLTGLPDGATYCPECGKTFARPLDASADYAVTRTVRPRRLRVIGTALLLTALIGSLFADIWVYRDMGHWQAPFTHGWDSPPIEPRLWPKPYYFERPESIGRHDPHMSASPTRNP